MKLVLALYGTALVVVLALARRFEAAGWTGIGTLDVAAAVVDALLALSVVAGLLLAGRLGLAAWAGSMARWREEQARAEAGDWPEAEVVGVTSWRPGSRPAAELPAESAPPPAPHTAPAGFTYVGPTYAREAPVAPPFPDRRGRRI